MYEITFTLREGVSFHDGSPWNAAACKLNLDHIMGGDGTAPPSYGNGRSGYAMQSMHDWMGFTQSIQGWSVVDDMTFRLTLSSYYEAVLRELAVIRPFRMVSLAVLPPIENMELSHNRWRHGSARQFPFGCDAALNECYTMRGISAPIGTGPYQVISKVLSSGRVVPAVAFNATCYADETCTYTDETGIETDETVSQVVFTRFAGHRKGPTYDNVVLRSYDSVNDVRLALQDGSLDVAYGVSTLSPSAFIGLATAEEGANVVAHKASHDINTRQIVLNSAGALNTPDLRKLVMGIIDSVRQSLYDGELAGEKPMDTMFDPAAPHCSGLSSLSSIAALAATKDPSVNASALSGTRLRFMYRPDIPHEAIIAGSVISALTLAGIEVQPKPVGDREEYNANNCGYMTAVYSYNDAGDDGVMGNEDDTNCHDPATLEAQGFATAQECFSSYHDWDIAYSETWGPPYDPTAKLWDMTHGHLSGWCSAEADAPAVTNMESMDITTFGNKVRSLSTIIDRTAREAAYTEVLTTLHNEAIFVPLTAKRQTAVTSKSVSGFEFGHMEFDFPLANLSPTPQDEMPYPMTYLNCGVAHTVTESPKRVVTMNQGMTEFMLAMGLEGHMAGTAYLDDSIWPKYEAVYNAVPVLASKYPTDAQLMEVNVDFIMANYGSAFSEKRGFFFMVP
jgi:ABC-type transport system substrate-binding protein